MSVLRRLLLISAPVLLLVTGGVALLATSGHRRTSARGRLVRVCPRGTAREEGGCARLGHPETIADLMTAHSQRASRSAAPFQSVRAGALAHAAHQRAALAAQGATVSGSGGAWSPLGTSPLIANNTDYDQTNGSTQEGFVKLSGRIEDFSYDATHKRLYAAPVNGGVWESSDMGKSWHSIGDSLPTQVVASIAYSKANGGTLVALTGDPAFGFDSSSGLGIYRSTDDGRTWHHATGAPSGVLGFQLAVDPSNPSRIYAATGAGLFRSTDAGASFTNVKLPTGKCAGHSLDYRTSTYKDCFLANMVTDVVVQGPANANSKGAGAKPGAVLAAVGWRAGQKQNKDGAMQSPRNGIYVSSTGAPGSFTKVDTAGSNFTNGDQSAIGRVALGIANGPTQDHRIVYALVQDANKFNGKTIPDNLDEVSTGAPGSTVLNGIYVSTDFGRHWTQMESSTVLDNDQTAGSALEPAGKGLSYEPGVQAWYNEWIAPDPTLTSATGVPERVAMGLEEIWETDQPPVGGPQPQNGPTTFRVIGRYWNSCDFLLNGAPKCGPGRGNGSADPNTTTTHPDQHAALFVPDGKGGVTLVAGNDGGAYTQHVASGQDFSNNAWGAGANNNLHTLQPYDAEMAKDGTTYAGLQDNGELKILPNGTEYEVYGGDGFFTAVDPDHSNIAYEEYTGGSMSYTTDGGKTWGYMDPALTSPLFSTPFRMDPTDAKHIMIGGRDVEETTLGPDTEPCVDPTCLFVDDKWQKVFDLGTQQHPGDENASSSDTDPDNQLSAVDILGNAAYVGYCGYCDTITQGTPFKNGIATNVGGSKPPKKGTSDGWHIAKAIGLPNRYISSVAIDPTDPRTVCVVLAGYGRHWAPPGAVGENPSNVGTGHVFVSHDAGNHFTNISANLPDVPANAVMVRGSQLLVGTDLGAYISSSLSGGSWAVLGRGLPASPIQTLRPKPGDPKTVVAATYGRGVYTYRFP